VRRFSPALSCAALLAWLLTSGRAGALETPSVGGKPILIDITHTAVLAYHFNNRNDSDFDPNKQVDDFYGEFLDRLNVQASWWRFRLGVRLDTATYFHTLDRAGVAAIVHDQTPYNQSVATKALPAPAVAANDVNSFYDELHSRFLRTIYPSKLFLGYEQPGVEVTVGDFYVQLGRGLVFSVRKIDELAVDTTVRGVRASADTKAGDVQLVAMLFGGQMNPLRVDEASGRRLNGAGSPLFFAFPSASPLQHFDVVSDPGKVHSVLLPAQPSYLEDSVAGGKLEAVTPWFTLGADAAGLYREHTDYNSADPSREHDRILNYSGTLSVPSIRKHGDLYVEVAGQSMRDGHLSPTTGKPQPDLDGYAVYASASITGGPVSVSLEGKHYRNFFPLAANIDVTTPGFGAPEFSLVTYSQPPTAEPVYTEVVSGGAPGVCVSGGRGRIDYRFNRHASVYGWLGRYGSWSEIPYGLGSGCEVTRERLTNIWDAASGIDLGFARGRTHLKAWVGVRSSERAVAAPGDVTDAFYREGYVRYDMVFHLQGPFSLQLQGWHRHRYEPATPAPNLWTEGESYTALQWSPHLSAILGYEYLAKAQCEPLKHATLSSPLRPQQDFCNYVSGGIQWRSGSTWAESPRAKYVAQLFDAVNLFVGQRRGAVRCVSGVCRQFPPFEGARLEITSRF
jgi:hypothetical protein